VCERRRGRPPSEANSHPSSGGWPVKNLTSLCGCDSFRLVQAANPPFAGPKEYSRRDSTGGLMHYGTRCYLPELRRFISADTIVPNPVNPQCFN
jgi:hypothetical protein